MYHESTKAWAAELKVGSTRSIHDSPHDPGLVAKSGSESSDDLEFTIFGAIRPIVLRQQRFAHCGYRCLSPEFWIPRSRGMRI